LMFVVVCEDVWLFHNSGSGLARGLETADGQLSSGASWWGCRESKKDIGKSASVVGLLGVGWWGWLFSGGGCGGVGVGGLLRVARKWGARWEVVVCWRRVCAACGWWLCLLCSVGVNGDADEVL